MVFNTYTHYDKNLDHQNLADLIKHLEASPHIHGTVMYGTIPDENNRISDYDIVLIHDDSDLATINKMITSVDHRITDVIFVHVDDVKQALVAELPVAENSTAGGIFKKIEGAQILYDPDKLLHDVQMKLDDEVNWLSHSPDALYHDWYWLNHQLVHIRRMAQSEDHMYLLSVRLKMCKNIGAIYRAYFKTRHLPWRGEKPALIYWSKHDPNFYNLILQFLQESSTKAQVIIYERLIELALQPVGGLWDDNVTAIILNGASQDKDDIQATYTHWLEVIESK